MGLRMKNFNIKRLHQSIFMKKCDRVQKTNLTIFEPLGVNYHQVIKKSNISTHSLQEFTELEF